MPAAFFLVLLYMFFKLCPAEQRVNSRAVFAIVAQDAAYGEEQRVFVECEIGVDASGGEFLGEIVDSRFEFTGVIGFERPGYMIKRIGGEPRVHHIAMVGWMHSACAVRVDETVTFQSQ